MARQLPAALGPGDVVAAVTGVAGRLAIARPPDGAVLPACRLLSHPDARAGEMRTRWA